MAAPASSVGVCRGGSGSGWSSLACLFVSLAAATAASPATQAPRNSFVALAGSATAYSLCTKTRGAGCRDHTIWCASDRVGPATPNFAAYGNLSVVTVLVIESAPLLHELSTSALVGLNRLVSINVTFTGLQIIADGAFAPAKATLIELTMSNNKLTSLRANAFVGLEALRRLDLSGNRLDVVAVEAALGGGDGGLSALLHLDLSHNALRRLPSAAALTGVSRLRTIRLDGNPLRRLERLSLEPLGELRALSFQSRSLSCPGAGREAIGSVERRLRYQVAAARAFAECATRSPFAASVTRQGCLCTLSGCLYEPPGSSSSWSATRRKRMCTHNISKTDALETALSLRPLTRRVSTEYELAAGEIIVFDSGIVTCEFSTGNESNYQTANYVTFTCRQKAQGFPVAYNTKENSVTPIIPYRREQLYGMRLMGSRKYIVVASDVSGLPVLYATAEIHSLIFAIFANHSLVPAKVHLPKSTRCY